MKDSKRLFLSFVPSPKSIQLMLTTFGKTLLGLEGVKIFLASRFETASFAFAFDALKKIKKEPVYLGKQS